MPALLPLRLLLVEDLESDAALVTATLTRAGYAVEVQRVTTGAELEAALRAAAWDVVISDHSLPSFSAPAALAVLRQMQLDLPFIILSGSMHETEVVAALRSGAHDFITKNNLGRLAPALQRELREAENRRQRRRAEDALQETEARFAQVWETTSDAMALSDAEGLILAANPAYYVLYGFTPEQVLGQTFALIFPEAQRAHAIEQYKAVFADPNPPGLFESAVRRGDGSERFVESRATFVLSDGQRSAMLSTIRDVTERVRAGEALRASEERLRSTMDAMREGLLIISFDWHYLYVNDAVAIQGRKSRAEMLGRTMPEVYPGVEQTPLFAVLRRCMEQRIAQRLESEFRFGDGSLGWFDLSIQPAPEGLFILSHDITERKRAENRIQQQLDYLTALRDIDRAIISSGDLNLSLEQLLTQALTLLGAGAADILVYNQATWLLELAAARGFRTRLSTTERLRLGEGYAGRAALERGTVYVADLRAQTENARLAELAGLEEFSAYHAVPLIAKGQVRGVLEIYQRATLDPSERPENAEWHDMLETLAGQAAIAIDNATLFDGLQRSNLELTLAYDATIEGWSRALDLRDKETEGHSRRVTELTLALAETMGVRAEELPHVRRGALLHDMGKLGVPDHILLKPEHLTSEEWVVMRQHPTFAYELLSPISFLRPALDIPYCHHEKWDGTGYPRGLKGKQIPLAARLFSVVDVWDALRSDRPYRPAWPIDQVLDHIRSLSGTAFDPRAVEAFLKLMEQRL